MKLHVEQASCILIITSILSHLPQYHRIKHHAYPYGISLWYLVLNAIAWTEQFAFLLLQAQLQRPAKEIPTGLTLNDGAGNDPKEGLSFQGWLDVIQLGVVSVCSSVVLLRALHRNPPAPATKSSVFLLYLSWLSITFGPLILLTITPYHTSPSSAAQLEKLAMRLHTTVLNPLATLSLPLALLPQAHDILWNRSRGSLSLWGLTSQTIVFTALSTSWNERLTPADETLPPDLHEHYGAWYNGGGWATLDAGIWGSVQFLLLLLALRTLGQRGRRVGRRRMRLLKVKPAKKRTSRWQRIGKTKPAKTHWWSLHSQPAKQKKQKKGKGPTETSPLIPHLLSFPDPQLDSRGKSRSRSRSVSKQASPVFPYIFGSGSASPQSPPGSRMGSHETSPLLPTFLSFRSHDEEAGSSTFDVKGKERRKAHGGEMQKEPSPRTSPLLPSLLSFRSHDEEAGPSTMDVKGKGKAKAEVPSPRRSPNLLGVHFLGDRENAESKV